jgi:hypothetical protein
VVERFRDADLRRELTANARADLIDSGENTYERFIESFDRTLEEAGVEAEGSAVAIRGITRASKPSRTALARYYVPRFVDWLWLEHRAIWTVLYAITWVPMLPFRLWKRRPLSWKTHWRRDKHN